MVCSSLKYTIRYDGCPQEISIFGSGRPGPLETKALQFSGHPRKDAHADGDDTYLFGLGWVMNPPPEMKRDLYRVIPLLDWCECGVWQVWVASAGCVGVYAPESAYLHTMHHPKPVFPMLCCYWYGAAANSMMTT